MSTQPKESTPVPGPAPGQGYRGVKIFTYPKIIFFIPTFITALICGFGMIMIRDETRDPQVRHAQEIVQLAVVKSAEAKTELTQGAQAKTATPASPQAKTAARDSGAKGGSGSSTGIKAARFSSPQNFLAVAFLLVFGINLLIMSIDFPRFTVIALVLLFAALGFFILWLNVYFELLPPLINVLENIYLVANAGFYFTVATVMLINFSIILATRYLDYWEVLPNEILHNHGPFSDLERFPTTNLKFDKEIPDILEYALLRAGRLVLHISGQQRSFVMDNVLWINNKEDELKKLLSRMEVRITTDQETAAEQI